MIKMFRINIGLKVFLGYFLLVGISGWFIMNIFVNEIKPGVQQTLEDSLVDTSVLLAELASIEVINNEINIGNFAKSVQQYRDKRLNAQISGFNKLHTDYRVYITDITGKVIFDSHGDDLGADYSRWNDVYLTLRGQYGARSSPETMTSKEDTVMYVAAPIWYNNEIIGSLTVAKANKTIQPFIDKARNKITGWGALFVALSTIVGILFSWRLTRKINMLREYALLAANGQKAIAPASSSDELADLAEAMQSMREQLDGKQYVHDYVENLTHELKSPITVIQGSIELLSDEMSPEILSEFVTRIKNQSQRVERIIQNILGLAAVEHQDGLKKKGLIDLCLLINQQVKHLSHLAEQKGLLIELNAEECLSIYGESFLIGQAISNVLENAIDFSPSNACIRIEIHRGQNSVVVSITDQGGGIPDFAREKIFDKFYSLPRPESNDKSTGLGLNFVQEVMKLHGGCIVIDGSGSVGTRVFMEFPI